MMDELAESLNLSVDISKIPNNTHKPHPRYARFKETPNFADQQLRREQVLEHQKKKRQELFSLARGLDSKLKKDEAVAALKKAAEAAEKSVKDAESREVCAPTQEDRPYQYRDQLMLSEWMVTVPSPEELACKWLMVPCPQGKRTLIVATRGRTQAFSKAGHPTASFASVLPGGLPGGPRKLSTVLDCVWNYENNMYYIIDVLAWSNQPVLDCDTDFRFYWLKTKLEEMPALREASESNRYKFAALPYYECTRENMTKVMSTYPLFPGGSPNLDGLLFYHRETQYIHGTTPLVGWLKPYMLPDLLNIPVAAPYADMRPPGYENLEKHIEKTAEVSHPRGRFRGRGRGRGFRGRGRGRASIDTHMQDAGLHQFPKAAPHTMSETAVSGISSNCGGTPPSSAPSAQHIHQNAISSSAGSPGATPAVPSVCCETKTIQRPQPTDPELEAYSQEELLKIWKELDSYVDYLLVQASGQEAELAILREADERHKAHQAEACSRERALLRRLTAKEQEVQDYAVQVQELKNSTAPGPAALRAALLDPAVNLLIKKLRNELLLTRTRLEETQNELSAWKFTPDSNTGKRLMAKCRMLYQENEELGRIVASGRMAKLEGELALQKSYSQEVKKSQSEMDEFVQELDEDVEGMQSTIYYLQQELRKSRASVTSLEQELSKLRTAAPPPAPPATVPTPPESERTLNDCHEDEKVAKRQEDGVGDSDGEGEGGGEGDGNGNGNGNGNGRAGGHQEGRAERTGGGNEGVSPQSERRERDALTCQVVDRHRRTATGTGEQRPAESDSGDRRNNMNNNNGEEISAILGKRTCGEDSEDSDDVPLSKKLRSSNCAEDEDMVERDPPLMNGKSEDKQP